MVVFIHIHIYLFKPAHEIIYINAYLEIDFILQEDPPK